MEGKRKVSWLMMRDGEFLYIIGLFHVISNISRGRLQKMERLISLMIYYY